MENSLYYSQTLVRLIMEERLREARLGNLARRHEEPAAVQTKISIRGLFRQSPATCSC
jgi:hypothetical protein